MRLLLIMRLLLFTIGLKLSRGYYNRGGYYPSAVTITGNTVLGRYYIPSNSSHFPYLKSMQSDVTEWMAINPRNSKEMKFVVIILMFKIKM